MMQKESSLSIAKVLESTDMRYDISYHLCDFVITHLAFQSLSFLITRLTLPSPLLCPCKGLCVIPGTLKVLICMGLSFYDWDKVPWWWMVQTNMLSYNKWPPLGSEPCSNIIFHKFTLEKSNKNNGQICHAKGNIWMLHSFI
jgi:hypothetical protein